MIPFLHSWSGDWWRGHAQEGISEIEQAPIVCLEWAFKTIFFLITRGIKLGVRCLSQPMGVIQTFISIPLNLNWWLDKSWRHPWLRIHWCTIVHMWSTQRGQRSLPFFSIYLVICKGDWLKFCWTRLVSMNCIEVHLNDLSGRNDRQW